MESKIGAQTTASGDAADHRWRGRQIKRGCGDADRLTDRLKNKRLRKSREREAERGSGHPEWVCGICAKTNWITHKSTLPRRQSEYCAELGYLASCGAVHRRLGLAADSMPLRPRLGSSQPTLQVLAAKQSPRT